MPKDKSKRWILRFINTIRNRQDTSNTLDKKETYQTTIEALKMIYYVIIGLAIKEALSRTFLGREENFLGMEIFKGDNLITLFLLVAFLFTIVRFVHGASIHLEMAKKPEMRWKPLWDFAGFVLHGSLFYMMAISLKRISHFSVAFAFMVGVDAVWIIAIRIIGYIKKLDFVHREWLISDIVIILLLCLILPVMIKSDFWLAIVILIIAILAAVVDYVWNMRFYFPKGETSGTSKANA